MFQRVGKIIRANGNLPPSYYWDFMRDTYGATVAMAVRRQAESSDRVISLGRLIAEIEADPSRITRKVFLEIWPEDDHQFGGNQFDTMFAGSAGTHVDPTIPRADLRALESSARSVKRWADQYVAHVDAKPSKTSGPTFNDIDKAVDQIGDLFGRYSVLLHAADYVSLVPEIQHDWTAIFKEPWMRPPPRRS